MVRWAPLAVEGAGLANPSYNLRSANSTSLVSRFPACGAEVHEDISERRADLVTFKVYRYLPIQPA